MIHVGVTAVPHITTKRLFPLMQWLHRVFAFFAYSFLTFSGILVICPHRLQAKGRIIKLVMVYQPLLINKVKAPTA